MLVAKLLLEYPNVNPNHVDVRGQTPLFYAIIHEQVYIYIYILETLGLDLKLEFRLTLG